MATPDRTQGARTAATRHALISAGRALFGTRGYADVGTEEIVQLAHVSRGALYHHFTNKLQLFAAVFETVSADLMARIGATIAQTRESDPIECLRLGAGFWLDACREPEIHQISLVDAPAVLGVTHWREISSRYGNGLVEALLARAIDSGQIPAQPLSPLAHVLLGALREGALYLVDADDTARGRREVGSVIDGLIRSLDTRARQATRRGGTR